MSAKSNGTGQALDGSRIEFCPATPDRWPDVEALFGARGACGGCWCMWWRLTRSQFEQQQGEANRMALKALVLSGQTPGLLAYVDHQPAGWCCLGPRESFPVLDRSRVLKRVDDQPVWSVVCFFVARPYRRLGLSGRLLQAAVDYAADQGARIVEGYPVEPRKDSMPDIHAFTGIESTFRRAGFVEVARRSAGRPIVRYVIRPKR